MSRFDRTAPATVRHTATRTPDRVYGVVNLEGGCARAIFLQMNVPHEGALADLTRRLGVTNTERVEAGRAAEMNTKRRTEMEAAGVQEVRQGRGDTGVSVFAEAFPNGLENLSLETVVQTLFGRGYRAISASAITIAGRPERKEKDKFRIRVVFRSRDSLEGAEPLEVLEDRLEELRHVAKFAHVWENPDGTSTVNLIGRNDSTRTVTELGFDQASGRWFVDTEVAARR